MKVNNEIKKFSRKIGLNNSLIQGAGGNISWKEADTLWIKASGTWLADAEEKEIFVPVDLPLIRLLIDGGASSYDEASKGDLSLRPSIETALHALLPHPIVVHVHAVDIIARAVQSDAVSDFSQCLDGLKWAWIDYVKPGPELAKVVAARLETSNVIPDILVLGNHGLVVAGTSVGEVDLLLQDILTRCEMLPRALAIPDSSALNQLSSEWSAFGYRMPRDNAIHALAIDQECLELASSKWVMYPDHAVFLGGQAAVVESNCNAAAYLRTYSILPACVLVRGKGVVVSNNLNLGQEAMLKCYLDVTLRLGKDFDIRALDEEQIAELLGWDAEKYRQALGR